MTAETGRLVLLGGIAALGSLAIQIIVPALPLIVGGIDATAADGQLIIAVYLAVLALGQLASAPIADRYGRRPVLLWSVGLFMAGTAVCAVADSLAAMLAGRAIQAVGAAASLVTGRAMATDRAPVGGAAAPLAILASVTLISPAIAPAIGGALTGLAGWRALFGLLLALAAIGGVLALRILPETRPGDHQPLAPRRLLHTYWHVARQRGYLALALSNGLINGGFYLFLAVSPFILDAAGATPTLAGLFYSAVACSIIGGTLMVPAILRRWPSRLRPLGSLALGAGAVVVIGVAFIGASLTGLFVAMSLIAFGAGLTGPALLADAIESQRDRASSATSLFGTVQMGGAALISTVIVRLAPSPAVELALIGVLVGLALAARHLSGGARDRI